MLKIFLIAVMFTIVIRVDYRLSHVVFVKIARLGWNASFFTFWAFFLQFFFHFWRNFLGFKIFFPIFKSNSIVSSSDIVKSYCKNKQCHVTVTLKCARIYNHNSALSAPCGRDLKLKQNYGARAARLKVSVVRKPLLLRFSHVFFGNNSKTLETIIFKLPSDRRQAQAYRLQYKNLNQTFGLGENVAQNFVNIHTHTPTHTNRQTFLPKRHESFLGVIKRGDQVKFSLSIFGPISITSLQDRKVNKSNEN